MKGLKPTKLRFIKPDGGFEKKDIHYNAPSNNVRKKLQELQRKEQVETLKFSKQYKNDYPTVYEIQNGAPDKQEQNELIDKLTPEEFEVALEKDAELSEVQTKYLVETIKTMIDFDKTTKISKFSAFEVEQLKSELDEPTVFEDKDGNLKEYDFWGEQELDILRQERYKFFRRAGIGQA